MLRLYIFVCLVIVFSFSVPLRAAEQSEQGQKLPAPYASPSARNAPLIVHWPENVKPISAAGFDVQVYANGLENPRWLYLLPSGDVLIAESAAGRITALSDTDGDGIADRRHVFLKGLNKPFGMALIDKTFYVACTDGVWTFPYQPGLPEIAERGKKIIELPSLGYNNHWTRNILVDPERQKLFVTVGSGTNVDQEHSDEKDWRRAAISQANFDGSDFRLYAGGLRNPVGLAIEPHTHSLWAVVNERDGLGDDLVPDYLTSVKENGFYGWPYSYFGQNVDPRHKGERVDLVAKAIVPDYPLGSHVAALGLCFYQNNQFPKHYREGAYIGEHGSWNRAKRVGYKVVFVPFKNGKPSGQPEDFLTGFMKNPEDREVYGRPVGVIVAKDGSLLVADDGSGTIWRVSYKK
jgi:glucose/arabinose dehydrogenase